MGKQCNSDKENNYASAIQKMVNSDDFNQSPAEGKLGTHSIKMFVTTKCHHGGASKDIILIIVHDGK